jgi:hypothetical protein
MKEKRQRNLHRKGIVRPLCAARQVPRDESDGGYGLDKLDEVNNLDSFVDVDGPRGRVTAEASPEQTSNQTNDPVDDKHRYLYMAWGLPYPS